MLTPSIPDRVARQAQHDDDNILVSAVSMIRTLERIINSKEPRHFLHTATASGGSPKTDLPRLRTLSPGVRSEDEVSPDPRLRRSTAGS